MQTKVYAYAAKVMSGDDDIAEQISAAHKYYNQLIELRRAYSSERERLIRATCPDYDAAQVAVENANAERERLADAIRAANAKAKRKRASPEETAALKEAGIALKAAREARKVMRAAVKDDMTLQAALGQLDIDFNGVPIEDSDRRKGGKFKLARETCGVYWGTYLKIENAIEMAVKKFGQPRFRRWDGSGQIAVQVQGGVTFGDVLAGSGRIGNLMRFAGRQQRGKHRVPWMTFKLCVKTDDKKKPVWCEVRAAWPRELPNDAKIMGVSLVRIPKAWHRMSDGKYHPVYDWSLQFTVRTAAIKPRASTGACGIDVGWRLMEDGSLRVAYYAGDDGKFGELRLPPALLARWNKSESIQGIRDRHFTAALAALTDWKAALTEPPEWFVEASKFCIQWKSKYRLGKLLDQWADNRIQDDEAIYEALCEWRARDVHLDQYASHNQEKAQRIRKSLYLQFAADLRKRYGTIAVEDFKLTQKLARKKSAGDNTFDPSKRPMRIASVGLLRQIFTNDGAVKFEAANTTKICHLCGSIEEWDQAKELVHSCSQCHAVWGQDYNAAMNLLAAIREMKGGDGGSTANLADDPSPKGDAPESHKMPAREADTIGGSGVASTDSPYVGRWAKRKADRSQKEAQTSVE